MRTFTIQESRRLAYAISVNCIFFNSNSEMENNSINQGKPNFSKIKITLSAKGNPFFLSSNSNEIDENIFSSNSSIIKAIDPYNDKESEDYQSRFSEQKYSRTFKKGTDIFLHKFHNSEFLDLSDVLIFLLCDLPSDVLDKIIRMQYNIWESNRLSIKSTQTFLQVLSKENNLITNNEKEDIIEIFSGFSNVLLNKIIEINLDIDTPLSANKLYLVKIKALMKLIQLLEYDISDHLNSLAVRHPFSYYKKSPYIASAMVIYNDQINISLRDIQSFGMIIHALNQVIEEHNNLDDLFNPLSDSKFNPNNWVPIFEFLHDGIKERCHQELLQSQKNEDITSTYIHMEWSFPSEIFTPFVSTLTFSSIDQVTSLFEFLRNNQLLNGMADYAIQFMVDKQIEKKSH